MPSLELDTRTDQGVSSTDLRHQVYTNLPTISRDALRPVQSHGLSVVSSELTVVTAAELYPHLTELSPTLVRVATKPAVVRLREPLRRLSEWKDRHQLYVAATARMVHAAFDEAGLPHVADEVAEEADMVHDNGFANNPQIEDEQIVNSKENLTEPQFRQVRTHAHVGAPRISEPVVRALVGGHDSYVKSAESDERRRLLADPVAVSKLSIQGRDVADAVTSDERPYKRWKTKDRFGTNDRTQQAFTLEETRDALRAQVPLLPERVREAMIDAVHVVYSAPVRAEIRRLALV